MITCAIYCIVISMHFYIIIMRAELKLNVIDSGTFHYNTVVWEKFIVEYFHVKIVHAKIFSSSRVADENFLTTN